MHSTLYTGIAQLVQMQAEAHDNNPLRVIKDAFLWVRDGRIVACGRHDERPRDCVAAVVDLEGRAVIPGLVDSHTHVVFAAARMDEMARRARGETYEDIARAGGGIARSVADLTAASDDEIVQQSLARLRDMFLHGTTTVEIKSGYGLHIDAERRHLQLIDRVARRARQGTRVTLLAHGVPTDRERGAHLTDLAALIGEAAQHRWAHHVDIFVERGAFTADEARRLASAARGASLPVKLHVDQLHDGGGAVLAAELAALSADHLEFTPPRGAQALAQAGVVATLLPGCGLFLGKGPWPNGRSLRDAGASVAVATDCNPGSSMVADLLLCATLAVTRCGLTLEESLWAVTRGGAKALGLNDRGCLVPGERADFVVLEHDDWRAALYYPGSVPLHGVGLAGVLTVKS